MFSLFSTAMFFALGVYWVAAIVNKMPRDVINMRAHYQEGNKDEFWSDVLLIVIYWGSAVVVFYLFVYPVGKMILGGILSYFDLLEGFRI
jgi:ABC-type branched-subunit amino acid transport system permease subunit